MSRRINLYSAIAALFSATQFSMVSAAASDSTVNAGYAHQQGYQEVFVTAAMQPVTYLDSLAADTVLDAWAIEALQPRDLPDLLRQVAGLDFDDNGGRGALSALRVRGTESDHVLYLVDGVRVADATSGSTALPSIPLAHIDRIEIVRGPRSSLYGADAIGGVVQVFTKTGAQVDAFAAPSLRAEYGSHDLRKAQAGVRGNAGGFFYRASAGYEETNGIDRTVGSSGVDADRDGYREKNFSLAAGYRLNDQANAPQVRAGWTGSSGSTEFDNGVGSDDYTDFTLGTGHVNYRQPLGEAANLEIIYGHTVDDQRSRGAFPSHFRTRRDSARVVVDLEVADDSKLTTGIDYYRDKVKGSATFARDARENRAFFLQYLGDFQLANVQLAARLDDNQAFGEEITANAALGIKLGAHSVLSFSAGTGFKAPTFNDLYFVDLFFTGNPDLKPESSTSYEVLLKTDGARMQGYIAVHYTEVENLIAFTQPLFDTVENLDKARIRGADTGIAFSLASIDARLGLAYVDAEDARTKSRLPRRPRASAMLDLSRRFGDVEFGLGWNADSDRIDAAGRLAGYNLLNARATWHASEAIRIGAIVRNAAGNDYTLVKGFQEFRTEGQTASVFIEYAPQ